MTTGLFAIAEHMTFDLPLAEAETIALHVVPLRLESVTLAIKKFASGHTWQGHWLLNAVAVCKVLSCYMERWTVLYGKVDGQTDRRT